MLTNIRRRRVNISRSLLLAIAVAVLASCGGKTYTPGSSPGDAAGRRPAYHTVKPGDTLYSIAWAHGLDYRTVARWNGIRSPYTIYAGQRIRLWAPSKASKRSAASRQSTSAPKRSASSTSTTSAKKATARQPPSKSPRTDVKWGWPADGTIISTFARGDAQRKGLEIAGRNGDPVRAAAAGRVVYAGSGLRGLGMLVIVKHDKLYLSAYAHNRKVLVREADYVRAGQQIGEMGRTGTDRVKLHFEIRRDGKPVDPLRYLPPRQGH